MSSTDAKDLSLLIYSTLNNFGFKKENVCFRSKYLMSYKALKHFYNIVGSAGEGVPLSHSDVDCMIVLDDIICLDQCDTVENLTILETDNSNTAPGYTKVVLKNKLRGSEFEILLHLSTYASATTPDGQPYVSSTIFRGTYNYFKICTIPLLRLQYEITINGPAETYKLSGRSANFDKDFVLSLLFYGSEHLSKWANRTRYYTWPSSECVREISEMEGYLVPVGDKQSAHQDLEWRICYTTAEKELIASLNDIQIKVYVLLKMVAKSVLKSVCKALTSYVVKNVVFWVMEGTHQQSLSPDLIVNLIQKSLYFMKYCLENNHFPNYIIPERNLLRGAVNSREKQNVINFLSDCLREGGTVLLRVPKLYQCVSYSTTYPENVIKYGKWRDEAEKQKLLLDFRLAEICDHNFLFNTTTCKSMNEIQNLFLNRMNDAKTVEHLVKLLVLVMPDFIPLLLSGKTPQELHEVLAKRLEMISLL
ncbi:uncharacterized protein LOC123554348 [Mercenaria mercenaria]|uniref:uncharacterized protein LOC123554348 n=1 Tax=Mercenaria mercenaria TaxID=6596 RepID=UPI00234E8A0B|nr:uncharacterized protein LOC123554348 [Mercenaria mercenaria]